jgi:hypothetical protein
VGIGSQFGPTPDGLAATNEGTDFRFGLRDISKEKGLIPASRYTGRRQIFGEAFLAEIAFLHDPVGTGGVCWIDPLDKGAGIFEVHAPGPVWAGGDAEPTSDAPVIVHHDYAVNALERSLRRAHPDARRIVAVVARNYHFSVS